MLLAKSHMYAYLGLLTTSVPKLLANPHPCGRPCVHGEDGASDPACLVACKEPDTSTYIKLETWVRAPSIRETLTYVPSCVALHVSLRQSRNKRRGKAYHCPLCPTETSSSYFP
jgi:hypothetical protein